MTWIVGLSIAALQRLMTAGQRTSVEIVDAYLERIRAVDSALNSVVEANPDARQIAADLDVERRNGTVRGPLHGVPILIKENIDTADQMLTTAGSLALTSSKPLSDSATASNLRAAGAVILGKTAMSEWANFRSRASTSGWSGRAGQVHNPYSLDRSPGGSSSGSGVAASACLAAATIGTETDGSIVSPATANGVVGLKPTVGLTSRSGVVPISSSQDTIGPLARSVADAAVVLTAIAGPDQSDQATNGVEVHDYSACVDDDGLRGARIGVARKLFGFSAHADRAVENALETMRAAGAILVEIETLVVDKELEAAEGVVLLQEFRVGLNEYLATRSPGSPRSLAEVIEFNVNNADVELQHFGQGVLEASEATGPTTQRRYLEALATIAKLARTQGLDRAFDQHDVDVIVAPTGAPSPPIDLVNGDRHIGGSATLAATAGYPLISVPATLVAGLPVGITFMGRAWSEPVLIKLASGFEAARGPLPAPNI